MAEAAVNFVVERLGELLIQKVVFLRGVHGEVERLRDELVRMKCFLKDADEKQEDDARVRNWVSEIRAAAFDAEDIIETFILKVESRTNTPPNQPACSWMVGYFKRCTHFPTELVQLYKVGKDIQSIQARIQDISASRQKYGIRNLGEGASGRGDKLRKLRRSSPLGEDNDIVGLKEETNLLVNKLLNNEVKRLSVISIVGMGGIGKTTLAKKIYNLPNVRAAFDCCAWACVSEDYRPKEILQRIIKQALQPNNELLERMEKMQEEDLEEMLHTGLEEKRYLLVLDDIWQADAWDSLAKAFPGKSNGSRVMLTTRNRDVALHADVRSAPFELRTLDEEESWKLFLKKALIDDNGTRCPPEVEGIGKEIVRKCAGLPLGIIVMGGLLSRKKLLTGEWERVLKNFHSHIARSEDTSHNVSTILSLSYIDLPYHLKSCFLYLAFFPEDHVINTRKLLQLWIAEGLIQHEQERCAEEIARDYLDELVNRNMVQVVSVSASERVKLCRVHDLLRDLSIRKAKEEIFLEIHGHGDFQPSARARHHAIYCHTGSHTYSGHLTKHLRSLMFLRLGVLSIELHFDSWNLKLLRVLDIDDIQIDSLPAEIGELIHLRYLGLKDTMLKVLPSSIGCLKGLLTLDISSYAREPMIVPNVLWKMESLTHLYMNRITCTEALKVDTLKHLQTLTFIHVDDWLHNDPTRLTSLQKLGVYVKQGSNNEELFNSISKLKNPLSLCLSCQDEQFGHLKGLGDLCCLSKLTMKGMIWNRMFPSLEGLPNNLFQLTLEWSKLTEDPIRVVEKLPKLSILKLRNLAYKGNELAIYTDGFPQLQYLEISGLNDLQFLNIEEGAMPRLRCLRITECLRLLMLPEAVRCLTALQKLECLSMTKAFVDRVQGLDSYKVCHVPSVTITRAQNENALVQYAALRFIEAIEVFRT